MSALRYYRPRTPAAPRVLDVDLCAFGQSPAALTAAIEARKRGLSVALVLNSPWLGGLTAGGLSNTDIGNKRSIGGLARGFYRRVGARYGVPEEWRFEPHVAENVLRDWLREHALVPLLDEWPESVEKNGPRLAALRFQSGLLVRAKHYIDASYEGDLLALAGVSFTVGRESNATHNETLNGVQFRPTHNFDFPVSPYRVENNPASGLLPGINPEPPAPTGSGDRRVQAYNFRLCLTQAPDRVPFPKPDAYNPLDYELLARYLRAGWRDLFRKFDPIRGSKTDTNNHGAVSTDFIGGSDAFPLATYSQREAIFQKHVRWQQGLFWFLATDPRVPAGLQTRLNTWGLAADEFADTAHWPRQLYIREARRMVSDYVINENDCRGLRVADDPVGLGAYAMDSHNCQRVVLNGLVRNEGDVQEHGFAPYPIAYRALTPRRDECQNLLVPVCLSASHIAYGSVRMEPVFMILGQSAAIAADLALKNNCPVQDIPRPDLRRALLAADQQITWSETSAPYEPEAPPPPLKE